MTTAAGVLTAVAALIGVLLSLGSLSPRARRMRRLEQRVALLKDVPEGDLRKILNELALTTAFQVKAHEPKFDMVDAITGLGARVATIGFFATVGASVGRGLAGEAVAPPVDSRALLLSVLSWIGVGGQFALYVGVLIMGGALVWGLVKWFSERKAKGTSSA